MTELVQLEHRHADFSARKADVIVVSVEGLDDVRKSQADFPHLMVLSDHDLNLAKAAGVIHPQAGPDESDIELPTTLLVDRLGIVRWIYRSPSVIARLSPDEVLRAIDQYMH